MPTNTMDMPEFFQRLLSANSPGTFRLKVVGSDVAFIRVNDDDTVVPMCSMRLEKDTAGKCSTVWNDLTTSQNCKLEHLKNGDIKVL